MRIVRPVPYSYYLTPERVIDGDTLVVLLDLGVKVYNRQTVRLWGINAPELHGPNASVAQAARVFVENWIAHGKAAQRFSSGASGKGFSMLSNKYDEREKYGRMLGTLYRDDDPKSLNAALLEAKLATLAEYK